MALRELNHARLVDFNFHREGKPKMVGTDIDYIFEDGKLLILVEVKMTPNKRGLEMGQSILLERMVRAWQESREDRHAVAIFATYGERELTDRGTINLGKCHAEKAYFKQKGQGYDWKESETNKSCLEAMNHFCGIAGVPKFVIL